VSTDAESLPAMLVSRIPVLELFPGRAAVLDADGTLVDSNVAWRESFAHWMTAERASHNGDINVLRVCERAASLRDPDAERILASLSAVLSGEVPAATVEYAVGDSDARRWTELSVRRGDPALSFVLVGLTDVTDRKAMERELGQARKELTQIAGLASIGELVGSLAHELSQPLAAILSNAQAAERVAATTRDKAQAEIAADIIAQSRRAREILTRMRAMTHHREPQRVPVTMNQIVAETLRLLEADERYLRVPTHVDLDPTIRPTRGDPAELQQVVMSLLLIAFDSATGVPGSAGVSVRSRTSENAASIELSIRSLGRGLPERLLATLTAPLFASIRDGMSLGLAVTRSVVEQHGGRLAAENHLAGGIELRVTLPADREPGL
jgi:C4-dicarboxylate-specific signal transduction histidine kinase